MNIFTRTKNKIMSGIMKYAPTIVIERTVLGSQFGGGVGYFDRRFRKWYALNQWVFRCVKVRAQNIAQVELAVFEKETQTRDGMQRSKAKRIDDHFIQDLLERPNRWQTSFDLKFLTVAYLDLTGDAFWLLGRLGAESNREAGAIVMLRPDRVTIVPGERESDEFIVGYQYSTGESSINLSPSDVIHFKNPNPNDDYRGQAVLEPLRMTVDEQFAAQQYSRTYFKNSAIPKGAITFPEDLSAADYKRIRAEWNAEHQGVANANKIAIFELGAKWQAIGTTLKDMDFATLRKMTRDDIGAAFGVPPVLLNSYERATYNNAWVQEALLWRQELIPLTKQITQILKNNIEKFFAIGSRTREARGKFFAFDMNSVWSLRKEELDRQKIHNEMIKSGTLLINEAREADHREPTEYGDTWYKPMSLVDVSAPPPAAPGAAAKALKLAPPIVESADARLEIIDLKASRRRDEHAAFIIKARFFEDIFDGFVKAIFRDQQKAMTARLRAIDAETRSMRLIADERGISLRKRKPIGADVEVVLFDLDEAVKFTDESADEIYRRMTKDAGQRGFSLAQAGGGVFDLDDPIAAKNMLAKKQTFATKINGTTWNDLKAKLSEGIETGATPQELADMVDDTMHDRIMSSKHTIARTEVLGAQNGGLHDGFEQSGIVKRKAWTSAFAASSRDGHMNLDGTKKLLRETFTIVNSRTGETSQVKYPGDSSGAAWAIINCLCTLFPFQK